jgi:hypothetical protein
MSDQPISSLAPANGWHWFRQGVSLFRRQPAVLSTVLFFNLFASALVGAVPIAGPVIVGLLVPSMALALMQACALIDQDRPVDLRVLGAGFRPHVFQRLLGIGALYLVLSLLLSVLAWAVTDIPALEKLFKEMQTGAKQTVDPSVMWPAMGVYVLNLLVLVSLAFSVPLVAWQRMSAPKALFYSIVASVRAAPVFLVLLGGWILTMLLTVMMAIIFFSLLSKLFAILVGTAVMLVFVLLLQCALYAGYRQVFGMPDLDGSVG